MKNFLLIFALIACSMNVMAEDWYFNNAPAAIKVRNAASLDGQQIGVLQVNERVIVYSITGDWAVVKWQGHIGYVAQKYLTLVTSVPIQPSVRVPATAPAPTLVPAPAPVPVSTQGKLTLSSEPSGATVYVDGKKRGITPIEMRLNDDEHSIRLELENYVTYQRTIVLDPGEKRDIVVPLEFVQPEPEIPIIPDSTDVKIISNIPTLRKVDRHINDTAETSTYHLSCGRHYIELKAEGYLSKSQYFYVNKQSDICAYSFKMKPRPKKQFFFMIDYNWGDIRNTSSLGFRVGQTQLVGWYATMNVSLVGSHYGYDKETRPLTIDKASRNKIAVMGGINLWLGCPLYFYTGIGYGYQGVSYRNNAGIWHRGLAKDNIGHGVAWECGLQGNIKGFTPRLGYALIGGDFLMNEVSVGIGYTFKSK